MRDYVAIATAYAQSVVDGQRPAGKWLRLACQRHFNDLARVGQPDFPYSFNPELVDLKGKAYRPAVRICLFAELMPHVKGDWAGRRENLRLEPWQAFILVSIFGWIHTQTLKRRFRRADVFVPRKNGKSALAAAIGNYMLAVDDEFGAEVYSGATSRNQALEVFRPARLMALAAAEFRARFGVVVNVSNLSVLDTNSKFEPVIGKPGDGASPSCAIVDEYHEHTSSDLYDTMATGMGARSQPLLLVITTAGTNIGGPCYSHQGELQKVLAGVRRDDQRFGIIYAADAEDDWASVDTLIKANPNFGVSVSADSLQLAQQEAVHDPRKRAIFRTKHLNVWVAAASPWLDPEKLQAAGDPTLNLDDFRGEDCWVGLDLASKNDIASMARVFRRDVDGKAHYYVFTRNYLPQAAVQRPENGHYQAWVESGHLVQTVGNMINLNQIQEDVEATSDKHVIAEIPMDSWGSREIAPSLQEAGYTVIDVPMNTKHLSEPMKTVAALLDDGRFHHDGNLATVWMFSNVEVFEDRNANIFPRKASAEKKIDAAIATILAMGRAILGESNSGYHSQAFVDLNAPAEATA